MWTLFSIKFIKDFELLVKNQYVLIVELIFQPKKNIANKLCISLRNSYILMLIDILVEKY